MVRQLSLRRAASALLPALFAAALTLCAAATALPACNIAPLQPARAISSRAPVGLAILEQQKRPQKSPAPQYINPVTGLATEKQPGRPVAVVINNIRAAQPQLGVGRFELMFEYPAEGEITRLVDVMYDWSGLDRLGSVRSMRDYFITGALPLDPIYLHYGYSPAAKRYIESHPVTSLNGINAEVEKLLYWRDPERARSMAWEHSVLTSSDRIDATLAAYKVRTETEAAGPFFDFSGWQDGELAGNSVVLSFAGAFKGGFVYDGEKYLRRQFSAPHLDGATGEQLSCETVIVIKTYCREIPGDDALRRQCDITGSGEGFAFSGGTGTKIEWTRDSVDGFYSFTADGRPLTLDAGKIWICVLDTARSVTYE